MDETAAGRCWRGLWITGRMRRVADLRSIAE